MKNKSAKALFFKSIAVTLAVLTVFTAFPPIVALAENYTPKSSSDGKLVTVDHSEGQRNASLVSVYLN